VKIASLEVISTLAVSWKVIVVRNRQVTVCGSSSGCGSMNVGGLDTFLACPSPFIALGMEDVQVQSGRSPADMQKGK